VEPRHVAERLARFGSSIFAEMTGLAQKHGAVNLSQGFPDFDGPDVAKRAAIAAIEAGHGQYARMIGVPTLNAAIAEGWAARGFGDVDPEAEVTVTSGCSEAIAATLMGLLNPGDEVVVFEPYFDFYTACTAMAGGTCRFVTLRPPMDGKGAFGFDEGEFRAAFTARTRVVIVNSPHNPTGKVFTRQELELIAGVCRERGVVVISDEVYEHLIYEEGMEHVPIATLPGMRERTITMSSMGKTFALTGWKIGWTIAPPALTAAVRAGHQFMTFSSATPLQHGAAAALRGAGEFVEKQRRLFAGNRDRLCGALAGLGLTVFPSHSTYFVMADHSALGLGDDRAFCRHLTETVGVAAIPPSVFYGTPGMGTAFVRFAFCKKAETIDEAIRRLQALRR